MSSTEMIFRIHNGVITGIRSRSMREGLLGKSLEDALQTLFEFYPEILPGAQIAAGDSDPPRFALLRREMPIGSSWSLDHLYVDQFGILTLVETKLVQNPESRREVIGQVIEYAANARSSWDVGRIRERAAEYWSGRNLEIEEVLKERLGSEIDVEHLWEDVGAQLDEGNIRLIIASDRIRPEVRRMIEYLNAEMRHAQILGLELNCYAEDDDSVIIAPRLIGQSTDLAERKSSSNKTIQWNEQRLREAFSTLNGEILVARMNELLDWAVAKSLAVFSPATNPTFGIQGKAGIRIFSIYSDGGVYAFLEETRYREHESDRETLVRKLKELNLFDPNLDLATVTSGRNMKRKIDELAPHEFGALMNLFEELTGT